MKTERHKLLSAHGLSAKMAASAIGITTIALSLDIDARLSGDVTGALQEKYL